MKNNLRYIACIIVMSLLPIIGFFTTSALFHTHDGLVHIPRIAAFYKALVDGHFPVRWAGDLNYGYGMPLFVFIYHIPYVISSFFMAFGVGLVMSFKLTLALSYIGSGIFSYLFGKAFFKNEKYAILFAVAYQFAPFRFVELIVRGSFGEVYTYTFLPLILFGLTKVCIDGDKRYYPLIPIATAFLILSHNAISLVFFFVCIAFVFTFGESIKAKIQGSIGLLFGLGLSAYYWIPALLEHKYTYGDLFMKEVYQSHFPPIINFFIPNIFNSAVFQTEGINVSIGMIHTIAICWAVWLVSKHLAHGKLQKTILFSLGLFGISIFFMQPVSIFFWERISLLRQFQFPWRLLSIVTLSASLLVPMLLSRLKKHTLIVTLVILSVLVVSTVWYWKPGLGYDTLDEAYYWNFPLNTTYYGETDVIWSDGPKGSYPKERVEVIGGIAEISDYKRNTIRQDFSVHASTNAQIISHTQYFPGWRTYVDSKQVPIQFQDPNNRGEITFDVPAGIHAVSVRFTESKVRNIADIISILSIVTMVGVTIYLYRIS